MSYHIQYSTGRSETHETRVGACAALRASYPKMMTHHDPDEGRTLVWATPEDRYDDDGSRAVAIVIPPLRER
jgi:hypothetical protein